MISSTIKNIIIIVVVLGLGASAYFLFFSDSGTALLDTSLSSTTLVGQDILVLTQKLKVSDIDPALLSGALLEHLQDFSVPLTAESQGRTNPFAIIGSDGSSVSTQTYVSTSPTKTTPTQ